MGQEGILQLTLRSHFLEVPSLPSCQISWDNLRKRHLRRHRTRVSPNRMASLSVLVCDGGNAAHVFGGQLAARHVNTCLLTTFPGEAERLSAGGLSDDHHDRSHLGSQRALRAPHITVKNWPLDDSGTKFGILRGSPTVCASFEEVNLSPDFSSFFSSFFSALTSSFFSSFFSGFQEHHPIRCNYTCVACLRARHLPRGYCALSEARGHATQSHGDLRGGCSRRVRPSCEGCVKRG